MQDYHLSQSTLNFDGKEFLKAFYHIFFLLSLSAALTQLSLIGKIGLSLRGKKIGRLALITVTVLNTKS